MRRPGAFALASFLAAACHGEVAGPGDGGERPATWAQVPVSGSFAPRLRASVVTDEAHGRLILFGGVQAGGARDDLDETWVLSGAGGDAAAQWTRLSPVGPRPPPRESHGAAYDAAGNRLIVFGGCAAGCSQALGGVWVLANADGLGGPAAWTQLAPAGAPPAPRLGFAMAYDAGANRAVVFGGYNGAGSVPGNTYSDVFALSNANGQGGPPVWTQLSPSGAPPPGQYGPAAAYDAIGGKLFVIGGTGAAGPSDAVDLLSNVPIGAAAPAWTALTLSGLTGSPAAVFGNPAFFDAPRSRVVLVAPASPGGPLLQWSLAGATWTRRPTANAGPSTAAVLGAGWFAARERLVVVTSAPALWALE